LEVSGGRGLSIGPPLCPEALASQTVVGMNVAKIELKKKSNTQTSTQSSPKNIQLSLFMEYIIWTTEYSLLNQTLNTQKHYK